MLLQKDGLSSNERKDRMHDEGLLQRCLDALIAMGERGIRHKNVFGMRGLMRGKSMFAAVGEASIIVKIPADQYSRVLQHPGVKAFTPGGQKLGTWVEIEDAAVADDPDLRDWLAMGLRAL
jgi:TfoX/Sxy family transcriptional regulator of competence genes